MKDQIASELPEFDYASLGLAEHAAARLRHSVDQIARIGRTTTDQTFTIGELLSEASAIILEEASSPKGRDKAFATWVASQCGITRRHATNYMAVHRHLGAVRRRVVDAGIAPTVLFTIASAPPKVVEQVLEAAEQGRRVKVKDVKALLQASNPDAGAEPIPLAQRGGTRGLLQLAQDKARRGTSELTEHLTEILLAIVTALEPASRGRRVEKAKLVDATQKRARLAHRGLIELTQCLRVPAYWDGTALGFDHEPLPDGGWSDLKRVLERVGQAAAWPAATELVPWLRQTVIPALEWALEVNHADMTAEAMAASKRPGRKPAPHTANDDAVADAAA